MRGLICPQHEQFEKTVTVHVMAARRLRSFTHPTASTETRYAVTPCTYLTIPRVDLFSASVISDTSEQSCCNTSNSATACCTVSPLRNIIL